MEAQTQGHLTVRQAARLLGVTPLHIKQLCRNDILRYSWTTRGRRIDSESVSAYKCATATEPVIAS